MLSSCDIHAISVRYDAFRKVKDGLLEVKNGHFSREIKD
jgi:hypothetical protein